MSTQTDGAPFWLFSFVDLAFLVLLALTQLGSEDRMRAIDFGEIAVPRLHAGETSDLDREAPDRWQLRVHPPADDQAPYELIGPGEIAQEGDVQQRLALEALENRLAALRGADAGRPLLAPHEDSRSQDMLEAVGLLEAFWAKGRLATVLPPAPGTYAAR